MLLKMLKRTRFLRIEGGDVNSIGSVGCGFVRVNFREESKISVSRGRQVCEDGFVISEHARLICRARRAVPPRKRAERRPVRMEGRKEAVSPV